MVPWYVKEKTFSTAFREKHGPNIPSQILVVKDISFNFFYQLYMYKNFKKGRKKIKQE